MESSVKVAVRFVFLKPVTWTVAGKIRNCGMGDMDTEWDKIRVRVRVRG